jgi:hypothetical protein
LEIGGKILPGLFKLRRQWLRKHSQEKTMKLAKLRISSANGQATEKRYVRFSTLLALVVIFSLAILAIHPAAAQTSEAPVAPEASWNIKIVEDSPYFTDMTDRSLRLDGNTAPHIAFGGEHLYYARWNLTTNNWFFTTVDSSPKVGRYASLALDSAGNPRIAYYDETNGTLKFAFSNDGGYNWNPPFTVDTLGPQPVAGPGTIEQAYAKEIRAHPELAGKLPLLGASALDPTAEIGVGLYTSIATDRQNRVHISYYDWNQGLLMYARWDGVGWTYVQVDGDPSTQLDAGKFSSIAVDQNDRAHISYMEDKYDVLKYAYDTGSGWSVEEIEPRGFPNFATGGFTSLVLDSDGTPYISYQEWVNWSLMFASPVSTGGSCGDESCHYCGPGDTWKCRMVDDSAYTGMFTSIGLDSSGVVLISYHNAAIGRLELASSFNKGRTWYTETVVSGNNAGFYTSLAVASNNNIGITHYSTITGLYSFIRWTGAEWVNYGLVYTGELGGLSSLAIGSYNIPYVSYYRATGEQLKMAFSLGGAFLPQIVYGGGGNFSSIKLSKSGEPRIAFYDYQSDNNDLAYAYLSGGVWNFQTVDTEGDVGLYPSLELDANDRPYISYYDATNGNLKFAYWNGSAWVVNTPDDSAADVGQYSSLTLNKNAADCFTTLPGASVCPMISYYDATNGALKLAFRSIINAWGFLLVDNTTAGNPANVGQYSSIDIDNAGKLHISYYDATNGWLKHAEGTKGASAWDWTTKEVVDNAGNVGQYTSIAADAANNIHVSYYDVTNTNLKYVVRTGGIWSMPQVVDGNPATDTGIGSSLALFSNGLPGISYYDVTNSAIKFATTYTGLMGSLTFLPLNFR